MKSIWNKLLIFGGGGIAVLSLLYYLISRFTYPIVDNHFSLKYALLVAGVLLAFAGLCIFQIVRNKKADKLPNAVDEIVNIFSKYRFLLNQLVGKEFKLKYRRSYLGVAWSLINPLLMMIIVSAVFSHVFRFNIENFPAYLILGQVLFNFFSEATQLSLLSIIGSGQLIKKVYVPKCIFPLSRVVSSLVNFLITFISVIIVFAYYRIYPTLTALYLPLFMLYFFVFTFGVSLILSTVEVFMRDMQHLYGVVLTALGYLTPVFYPVGALSDKMRFFLQWNPLYHYLGYLRNILLYHNCPTVEENAICLILSVAALAIGMLCFFKKQKKFILYI